MFVDDGPQVNSILGGPDEIAQQRDGEFHGTLNDRTMGDLNYSKTGKSNLPQAPPLAVRNMKKGSQVSDFDRASSNYMVSSERQDFDSNNHNS